MREIEIYVHIPFCIKKCDYCDFLSAPAGEEVRSRYFAALLKEVTYRAHDLSKEGPCIVTSVFVGGGTPTTLSGDMLAKLMEHLKECFDFSEECEISLECNPGTADFDKLRKCYNAGYNRISFGLQSALNYELKSIGRIHTYEEFLTAYFAAHNAGFDNINVDLMTALPGQTEAQVQESLERLMQLAPRPRHISAYSLILEENTVFWDKYSKGLLDLPDEDAERRMHWQVIDFLEKEGYTEYELSNLTIPGYECRHNIGYWTRREYIGIGLGAASLIGNNRFSNTRELNEYIDYYCDENNNTAQDYVDLKRYPIAEFEELSKNDEIAEFMFLGLRMMQGVSFVDFRERFGIAIDSVYGTVIDKCVSDGLLKTNIDSENNKTIYLTRRGQDIANYVFSQFIL